MAETWLLCEPLFEVGALVGRENSSERPTNCCLLRTQLLPTICSRASESWPPPPRLWSERLVCVRMRNCNQQELLRGSREGAHTLLQFLGEEKPQMRSNQKPYNCCKGLLIRLRKVLSEQVSLGLPEILFKVSFSGKLHTCHYCCC